MKIAIVGYTGFIGSHIKNVLETALKGKAELYLYNSGISFGEAIPDVDLVIFAGPGAKKQQAMQNKPWYKNHCDFFIKVMGLFKNAKKAILISSVDALGLDIRDELTPYAECLMGVDNMFRAIFSQANPIVIYCGSVFGVGRHEGPIADIINWYHTGKEGVYFKKESKFLLTPVELISMSVLEFVTHEHPSMAVYLYGRRVSFPNLPEASDANLIQYGIEGKHSRWGIPADGEIHDEIIDYSLKLHFSKFGIHRTPEIIVG